MNPTSESGVGLANKVSLRIVYFSRDSHVGFRNTRPLALCRALARQKNVAMVTLVGAPVSLVQALRMALASLLGKSREGRRLYRRLIGSILLPQKLNHKLRFVLPVTLFGVRLSVASRLFRKVNWWILRRWSGPLGRLSLGQQDVVVVNPFQLYAADYPVLFPGACLCADVFDMPLTRSAYIKSRRHFLLMKRNYRLLLARCRVAFANTEGIVARYKCYNNRFVLLPNGAEYPPEIIRSKDIENVIGAVKRPVAGFVGRIAETFDFALVERLLARFPDVTFLLAGPYRKHEKEVRRLQGEFNNVRFLGFMPGKYVPYFVSGCDVMMTFYTDYVSKGGVSLKLYDYLSQGKPVVTLPVPPVTGRDDLVYLARGVEEHETALKKALSEADEQAVRRRVDFVKKNTWDERAQTFLAQLPVGITR